MGEQRIILAAQDTVWRNNIKAMLHRAGYCIIDEAVDGLSVLKMVRSGPTELVITEALLPGMDGLEVARIVYETRLVPVILIASSVQAKLVAKAKKAGVFAILYDPLDENILVSTIELSLVKFRELVNLKAQVAELKESLDSRKIVKQAKGILMKKYGLTESEAFTRMRKQSMDKRVSMRAIAETIILANRI